MLAVSAWFDEGSESVVRELWRAMADASVDASLHVGPYRPHLTLGGAAVTVVLDAGALPLETTATRIGLIETPAEIERGCLRLGPELPQSRA